MSKISRLDQIEAELPMLVNLHHLREERRIITGFHEAYGRLFDRVGYIRLQISYSMDNEVSQTYIEWSYSRASSGTHTWHLQGA
ncbi:MAG: hypothetical protein FWG84_08190 [Bacteroidales bacterium]|nr:hypothetical protein [Bacteroidales bacterium]